MAFQVNGDGSPVKTVLGRNARRPRVARGYLGHHRPSWERAYLAAGHYARGLPIERPTLAQLALAYRVSVASIRIRLNGKHVTVDQAVESWRSWTPAQRAQFGRDAGVSDIWDDAIIPTIAEEREVMS